MQLMAKYIFIPGTTTNFPISSNWLGVNLSFDISKSDRYYVFLGAGRAISNISRKGITIKQSILYNVGVGIKMEKTIFEFEFFGGSVDEVNSVDPNPFVGVKYELMSSDLCSYLLKMNNN